MSANDYAKRAAERRKSGDLAGELADYDKLIEIVPHNSRAYGRRGAYYFRQGQWELALEDFRQSSELSPSESPDTYLLIWAARAQMGEREAADEELRRDIGSKGRGTSENASTPLPVAAPETFNQAAALFETGKGTLPFPHGKHSKELPSARFEHLRTTGPPSLRGWPLATAQFLIGEMKEKDYFSFPPPPYGNFPSRLKFWPAGKHSCEALFYAGLKRLVDGDKKKAIAYWQECATADGPRLLLEREFAQTELQNLSKEK